MAFAVPPGARALSFSAPANFPAGDDPHAVGVGDFNGDGRPDLAVANDASNDVSILLGDGSGGFAAAPAIAVGSEPIAVAVADLNLDGALDLAVANATGNDVSILLGDGDGSFADPVHFPVGNVPRALGVADFNGDLRLDLAVANEASDDVSILLGQAEPTLSGTATAAVTIGAAISASAVLAGGDAPSGEIVLRAYGPDDPACTSMAAFEQAVTVGGNGEYGTGTFTPPAAGTYNWTVSYGGDAVNAPVEIPCGATGLISMVAKAPAEPQPAGEGEPVTSPAPPAACPPLAVSSTGYRPAKRKQGRQVPGVRVRISVSDPSRLRVAAKLRFRRGGRARSADLGTHSLANSGRRNLRLALPGRLRRALPLGSRVRLALTISARSRCGLHSTSRRVIRTRVVKVLAGSRDRGRGVLR